jgi:hypothetical protein
MNKDQKQESHGHVRKRRSKRLRFKKQTAKETGKIEGNLFASSRIKSSSSSSADDYDNDDDLKHTKSSKPNDTKQPRNAADFEEWGPQINGFRFIRTSSANPSKSSDSYYRQRHNLVYGNAEHAADGYEWSYSDTPSYKSNDHDYLNAKYSKEEEGELETEWNYKQYLEYWQRIKTNGTGAELKLKLPVYPDDSLSARSIEKFLGAGSEHKEFLQRLKKERVRWHPDKMFQLLQGVKTEENSQEMIKLTFQFVNELWEKLQ